MPELNRRGPENEGPRTGRAMGKCRPEANSENELDEQGQGRGMMGGGRGRGRRHRFANGQGLRKRNNQKN